VKLSNNMIASISENIANQNWKLRREDN
jgi:hypothetical protein